MRDVSIFGYNYWLIGMESSAKDPNSSCFGFSNNCMRVIRNLLPFIVSNLHVSVIEGDYVSWHGFHSQ
jgi:hypothetical protein